MDIFLQSLYIKIYIFKYERKIEVNAYKFRTSKKLF